MLKIVHILTVILLLSALLYSILSCNEQHESTEPENVPFMIENLGVRFAEWDTVNNTAGDFLFLEISNIKKIVSEFGAEVVAYDGSLKLLPTMDFTIREDAPVFALAGGEISRMFYQEGSHDWETFKNDTTIYNESAFVYPGCLMESMVTY